MELHLLLVLELHGLEGGGAIQGREEDVIPLRSVAEPKFKAIPKRATHFAHSKNFVLGHLSTLFLTIQFAYYDLPFAPALSVCLP